LQSAGYKADMDATKKEILVRDMKDTQRQTGALKILDDSIVIDTSDLTATQVLGRILSIIRGE